MPRHNKIPQIFFISLIFVFCETKIIAQSISGYIHDEYHNPVAFANVFIRELNTGTATDEKGHYFLTINEGIYNLVISSIGYKTITIQIVVRD